MILNEDYCKDIDITDNDINVDTYNEEPMIETAKEIVDYNNSKHSHRIQIQTSLDKLPTADWEHWFLRKLFFVFDNYNIKV